MKRIVFSVFLFVVVSIAYHLMKQDDAMVEQIEVSRVEPKAVGKSEVESEALSDLRDEILALAEEFEEDVGEALPEGVIEDELVLRFPTEASLQAFLDRAKTAGLEVLGSDRRMKAARVRLSASMDAARVGELGGENAELDFNYEVVVPEVPRAYLEGIGNVGFDQYALEWLGVPRDNQSWGEGVKVAILDGGVTSHEVLDGGRISSYDLVDGGGLNGHGTAVASIIGGGNGVGIAPAAELISVRVLDADGKGDSFTLAQGIVQAVESGAQVISMSLGSFGYSSVLEEAVAYADSRGVLMVASAGNDGQSSVTYPARFESVIGVASVDANAQHSAFSNFGDGVNIAAPGVGVVAAWENEEWVSFSGTSASVPFVAGAVAGLMSEESMRDPRDAYDLLLDYVNDTGAPGQDARTGAGVLNLGRVLERNEMGILDVAVADVFLDVDNAIDGRVPVILSVQNRGTSFVNSIELQFTLGERLPQEIQLGALSSGEVASFVTEVSEEQLFIEGGLEFFAKSVVGGGSVDSKTSNDERAGSFWLVLPEDP